MACSIVQSKTGIISGTSVTTRTLTVTLTAPTAAGSSIGIAFGFGDSTSTLTSITDDKGNTYTVDQNVTDAFSGAVRCTAHTIGAITGTQAISIIVGRTVAANIAIDAVMYEIAGAGSIDVNTNGGITSSVAFSIPCTTANAGEVAIISALSSDSSVTYTQSTGYTQDLTASNIGVYMFSSALAASGANPATMTPSINVHTAWAALSFAPSVAPPPPTVAGPIPRVKFILP